MKRRKVDGRLYLTAAADDVDTQARTLAGLAVPFGPVGYSSMGAVTFAAGSIRVPAQIGRVKLLEQHDTDRPLGHATELAETPEGIRSTFSVAAGAEGDRALAMAADGRRDGLSVGVMLDAEVIEQIIEKWWDGDDSPTAATGELLEVSQVTIPAFADARVDGSAALAAAHPAGRGLLVQFDRPTAPPTPPALAATKEGSNMKCTKCGQVHAEGVVECAAEPTAELNPTAAPPGAAGAATIAQVSEAPVYTFDGRGPSLVKDACRVRFSGGEAEDQAAAERWTKFNRRMASADQRQVAMLLAAVETRTTAPNFIQQGYRPELLIEAIDRGRPLLSRVSNKVNLTDATPFRLPVEGDFHKDTTVADGATTNTSKTVTSATAAFTADDLGQPITATGIPAGSIILKINSATSVEISQAATATATGLTLVVVRSGIADHTEGTAHAAEGDLDVGDLLISPGAISGAFRLSRELIDATNPALDQVALRAMLRDYRGKTERKFIAAMLSGAPAATASVNTVLEVRTFLNDFYDLIDEPATFLATSPSYYGTLLADVDTTGRPMLPSINPVNAIGDASPGWTGANVDGVEFVKSNRLPLATAAAINTDDVMVGESAVSTFRFEEVEGPGVVKLALWAYFAAAKLRGSAVRLVTSS